jgi:hypothetical protein
VDVRLLYFEDCPHWRLADDRLREAVATLFDPTITVVYQLVRTPEEAEQAGFRGLPTILVNGRDPFAAPDDPMGLACRLYPGTAGAERHPALNSCEPCWPMLGDHLGRREVIGLVGAAAAVCCGLPVLLGVVGGITVVGLGPRCWLLLVAGTVGAIAGWWRWRSHRQGCQTPPVRDEPSVDATDIG